MSYLVYGHRPSCLEAVSSKDEYVANVIIPTKMCQHWVHALRCRGCRTCEFIGLVCLPVGID